MSFIRGIFTLSILFICSLSFASEDKTAIIQDFFERLKKNPKQTIQAPPERFGDINRPSPKVKFRPKQIMTQKAFGEADQINKVIRFYPENDFASDFETLFSNDLRKLKLEQDLWSGDYWATYRMGIAKRYTDDQYPNATSYNDYIDYFKSLGPIDFNDPAEMAKLSPAEKYDLLVRDNRMNMTNWSLFTSQSAYSEEDGKEVAMTWAGLCHGWAPAAFTVPRPLHSVKLDLGFGEVEFLPDDIKALATLLWARARVPNRFIGGRCNTKEPEQDEFGRIQDPECFDINPMAWHTVLINQMGIRKRSFVLDVTYDLEVWNQPVKAYELTYFNINKKEATPDVEDAVVPIDELNEDIFKNYRSKKAAYVVGVLMEIQYLIETSPSSSTTDSADRDAMQTVRYLYDIELDKDRNLIGGEWYHSAHPDFVWAPIEGAEAQSRFDRQIIQKWKEGSDTPPESWLPYAYQASREGMPLKRVVDELVRRSRLPQSPIEKE